MTPDIRQLGSVSGEASDNTFSCAAAVGGFAQWY